MLQVPSPENDDHLHKAKKKKQRKINVTLWLNARQPGTVSNRQLNARQSEIFTEFPPKGSFKLLRNIRCLFRNVNPSQQLICFLGDKFLRARTYYNVNVFYSVTEKPTFLNNHRMYYWAGLYEVFSGILVKVSDCRAFSRHLIYSRPYRKSDQKRTVFKVDNQAIYISVLRLTFRTLALRQSVSPLSIALTKGQSSKRQPLHSLRWPTYVFNLVVNTKLPDMVWYYTGLKV